MSGLYPKLDGADGMQAAPSGVKPPPVATGNPEKKRKGGAAAANKEGQATAVGPSMADQYNSAGSGTAVKRGCRDIFCLLLFIAFWGGMVYIGSIAIETGNLQRLQYGNDSIGNLCGVQNTGVSSMDLRSKPYQYLFKPWDGLNSYRICVQECPTTTGDYLCKYNVSVPTNAVAFLPLFEQGNCTTTIKSVPVMNRCVPSVALDALASQSPGLFNGTSSSDLSKLSYSDVREMSVQIMQGIYASYQTILICAGVAFVVSALWVLAMQFFSKIIVWITLVLVNVLSLGFTSYIWWSWHTVRTGNRLFPSVTASISSASYNEETLMIIGIVSGVFAVTLLLLTIALRTRIQLALNLVQEASRALQTMPLIAFFPIFKYIAFVGLFAWCLFIGALLATSGQNVINTVKTQADSMTNYSFQPNTVMQFLIIYYALGFYWTYNWIVAITQCTIAGSVASYYWTRDKNALPSFPVVRSLGRTLRYHLGSLAFGSLILATIQVMRWVILYVQTTAKRYQNNRLAQACLTCLSCCCCCLEKLVRILDTNAYIEIAIFGYSFCDAARNAFELLTRNAVRLMVVDKVGDFLLFLGKLIVTFASSLVGLYLLQQKIEIPGVDTPDVGRFWAVPLIIIAILAYVISSCFMTLYEMAIDTIFLCFCEDSERNDGSPQKPYFMSEGLKVFLDKTKKQAAMV